MKLIRLPEEQDWIDNQIDIYNCDKTIITFIGDILFHPGANVDKIEAIRQLFENGYCYHFAKMLEDAFPGGKICVCYPFGHIVYIYNKIAYDISGVSDAEYEELIPIEELGEAVNDFKHVEGKEYNLSYEEREKIKNNWLENNQRIYINNNPWN